MKFWQSLPMVDFVELHTLTKVAERLGFEGVMLGWHHPFEQSVELRELDDTCASDAYWQYLWGQVSLLIRNTRTLKFVVYVPINLTLSQLNPGFRGCMLSDSRVAVGIGAGSEEADVAGRSLHDRGMRIDAMVAALRSSFSNRSVTPEGNCRPSNFEPLSVLPGPEAKLPIYFGGISPWALRRAVVNQGWIGGTHGLEQLEEIVASLRVHREHIGELMGCCFEVIANISDVDAGKCAEAEAAGVTSHYRRPWTDARGHSLGLSLQEKLKDMEVFSRRFIGQHVGLSGGKSCND